MKVFNKRFVLDAAERAVKTAAQVAVALIGTGLVGIIDVDWQNVASVSAVAAVVSLLTSIASNPVGDRGTAAVVGRYAAK